MRTIIRNNYEPKAGDYHERIIKDEAKHKVWLFDCDGIYSDISKIHVVEEFGDSSEYTLSQKFLTEEFGKADGRIEEVSERVDNVEEALATEVENRTAADEDLQANIDQVAEDLEELKNSPDVVDIVNTKADLDAYDTSKLGDKDVVRVLNDETKDNASTYYRWENGAWTYIGMTGPYYTKAQTDTLLANKADKTDVYTKTEVDAAISNEATLRQIADEDLQRQISDKPDVKVAAFLVNPDPGRYWLELDDNVSDNSAYIQGGLKDGLTVINLSDSIGIAEQVPTVGYVDAKMAAATPSIINSTDWSALWQ